MKAIQLVKHGSAEDAFKMAEVETPKVESGDVLIKVEAFGLNYADVLARKGLYPDCPELPAIIGYEAVGRIEEIGDEVAGFDIGDRVVGFTRFGAYAEYACTDARAVHKISDDLDAGIAAALGTQYCTALFCAKSANLMANERVLIHSAAGGVGTALCQYAEHLNCEIYGTAGSDEKLNYIKELGVDHPINYRKQEFDEEIRNLRDNNRVDVIFDAVGGKTFSKGMKLLNYGGRAVLFGAASRSKGGFLATLKLVLGFGFFTPIKLMMKSQSIIGVNMLRIGDHKPESVSSILKEVHELFEKAVFKPQIGGDFSAEEISSAHSLLESRKSKGKIVIRWK